MPIGINDNGSFHPIIKAEGNKTKKEIKIPFKIPFILRLFVEIKKPQTIHIENAPKLASHVRF